MITRISNTQRFQTPQTQAESPKAPAQEPIKTNFKGFRSFGSPKQLAKTPEQILAKAKAQSTKMGLGDSIVDYIQALIAPAALIFLIGVAYLAEQNEKPGTENFKLLQDKKQIAIENYQAVEISPKKEAQTLNLLSITEKNGRSPAEKLRRETEFLNNITDSIQISKNVCPEAAESLHPTRDFVLQFPNWNKK